VARVFYINFENVNNKNQRYPIWTHSVIRATTPTIRN
jgi:hypothetical protein